MPPIEYFSNFNADERTTKFFLNLKPGNIAYGIVMQVSKNGLLVKIVCTTGSSACLVSDLNIKVCDNFISFKSHLLNCLRFFLGLCYASKFDTSTRFKD